MPLFYLPWGAALMIYAPLGPSFLTWLLSVMMSFSSLRWLSRKPRTMEIQTNLHPLFHQENTSNRILHEEMIHMRAEITQQLEQRKNGGNRRSQRHALGKQCFCFPNQLGRPFPKTGTLSVERPPRTKDLHASAESLLLQVGLWGSSSQVVCLMVGFSFAWKSPGEFVWNVVSWAVSPAVF